MWKRGEDTEQIHYNAEMTESTNSFGMMVVIMKSKFTDKKITETKRIKKLNGILEARPENFHPLATQHIHKMKLKKYPDGETKSGHHVAQKPLVQPM